jgi:hypothetical protein
MADKIDLNPPGVTQAAQSIAASLSRAAQPGPVPVATGASPIDGAAAGVAGAVATRVAASAADIAPRSADGLAKTQAAMTGAQAQDEKNAARIKEVPAEMVQGNRPPGSSAPAAQSVSSTPGQWDPWDDDDDVIQPLPSGPAGAGPGPSVIPGTGVPGTLMSSTGFGDPWDDWYDGEEDLVVPVLPTGPQGAGRGPGAIGPVPPGLI